MKVLLFDSAVDGHHADYAFYLAQHFLESGDSVTFATTADAATLGRLQVLAPSLDIQLISSVLAHYEMGRVGRVVQSHDIIRRSCRLAESQGADIVHHLFLDGAELAWLAARRPSRRTWMTFASRFTLEYTPPGQSHPGLAGSMIALAKRRALKAIVTRHQLDGIFVHSPRARSVLRELLGPGVPEEVVTLVADPAPPPNAVPQADAQTVTRRPGRTAASIPRQGNPVPT